LRTIIDKSKKDIAKRLEPPPEEIEFEEEKLILRNYILEKKFRRKGFGKGIRWKRVGKTDPRVNDWIKDNISMISGQDISRKYPKLKIPKLEYFIRRYCEVVPVREADPERGIPAEYTIVPPIQELIEMQKRLLRVKYGATPSEFGVLGPTMSKKLSKAKNFTDAANSIIEVGRTVATMIKTVMGWKDEISSYIRKKRQLGKYNAVIKNMSALAYAVATEDKKSIDRIVYGIRKSAGMGITSLREILLSEMCIQFNLAGIPTQIMPLYRRIFRGHEKSKMLTDILMDRRDVSQLEGHKERAQERFMRNLEKEYVKGYRPLK
jgi:hypothetical protein